MHVIYIPEDSNYWDKHTNRHSRGIYLKGMVGANHISIYRFIENLQLEQSLTETKKARLDAGEVHPLYSKA